jgi:hypothetical protein
VGDLDDAAALAMPVRVEDTPERVVIADADARLPMLAFQHAIVPAPRWPDPDHPAQIHLDLAFDDAEAGRALLEGLGAIVLRRTPYHWVFADPAGHPFCAGGVDGRHPDATRDYRDDL